MARNSDLALVSPLIDDGSVIPADKYIVCKKIAEFNDKKDKKGLATYIESLKKAPKPTADSVKTIEGLNKRITELESLLEKQTSHGGN